MKNFEFYATEIMCEVEDLGDLYDLFEKYSKVYYDSRDYSMLEMIIAWLLDEHEDITDDLKVQERSKDYRDLKKAWENVYSLAMTSDYHESKKDDKDIEIIKQVVEKELMKLDCESKSEK